MQGGILREEGPGWGFPTLVGLVSSLTFVQHFRCHHWAGRVEVRLWDECDSGVMSLLLATIIVVEVHVYTSCKENLLNISTISAAGRKLVTRSVEKHIPHASRTLNRPAARLTVLWNVFGRTDSQATECMYMWGGEYGLSNELQRSTTVYQRPYDIQCWCTAITAHSCWVTFNSEMRC